MSVRGRRIVVAGGARRGGGFRGERVGVAGGRGDGAARDRRGGVTGSSPRVAPAASGAATGSTSLYRVQASATRTCASGLALMGPVSAVASSGHFFLVGAASPFRVVSTCQDVTTARAMRAVLASKGLPSFIYRSRTCPAS